MHKPCLWVCSILFAATLSTSVFGQVVAVPDTFEVSGASRLDLAGNDVWPIGDDIEVDITNPPAFGTLTVLAGGSVLYEPGSVPAAPDRFSYRLITRPLITVALAPETSILDFGAVVTTPLGSAADSEVISVAGVAGIHVWANGDSVHVAQLDLQNVADVGLRFDYGSPIVFATLRVRAAADSISLSQTEPAAATSRSGLFGSFDQANVPFDIRAAVTLEGTGLFSGQVPTDIQRLETSADRSYSGSAVMSGSTLLLTLDVSFTESFPLADNTVDLAISGTLQGTGIARSSVQSLEVDVTVVPAMETAVEVADGVIRPDIGIFPNPARVRARLTGVDMDDDWILVDALGRVLRRGNGPDVTLVAVPAGIHYIRTAHDTLLLTVLK